MTPAHLESWYRDFGHVVVRRGRLLLGSVDEGRDLLHEVFALLIARPELTDEVREPVAWLYTLATRRAISRLRAQKASGRKLAELVVEATSPGTADALAMADLLRTLPEDEVAALVHFYVDGLTHDEIAVALACSRRHVGNLLQRGRDGLRSAWHVDDPSQEIA